MSLSRGNPFRRNQPGTLRKPETLPRSAPYLLAYGLFAILASAAFLAIGTDVNYVFLFVVALVLLPVLSRIAKHVSPYGGAIFLASFVKIFFASQIISLILLHRPDYNLSTPVETLLAINIGMLGAILGIYIATGFFSLFPAGSPVLKEPTSARSLRRLGYFCAVIGLTAQGIWNINFGFLSQEQLATGNANMGAAFFAYLAPLSILAMSALAAASLFESNGKTLFAKDVLIIIALYMLIVLPVATKTEPLKPLIALALVAIIFKWRIRLVSILAAAALLLFISVVLHPIITASRMEASGTGRITPVVFVSHVSRILTDPSALSTDITITRRVENDIGNNYFGESVGFGDRFTPQITDRIITSSMSAPMGGLSILEDAAIGILPQMLGFTRDTTSRQVAIEGRLGLDMRNRTVGWSNSGFVADAYLAGGLPMVALVFTLFGMLSAAAARFTFGNEFRSVLWIPYCVQFMLLPADTTFQRMAPAHFWGWIVLTATIFVGIKFSQTTRRNVRSNLLIRQFTRRTRTADALNTLRR